MLEHHARELQRLAPGDPATRRALGARRSLWAVGVGWAMIALLAVGTALHALWRRASGARRRAAPVATAAACAILAIVGWSRSAAADAPAGGPAEPAPAAAAASAAPTTTASAAGSAAIPDELKDWVIDDKDPASKVPGIGMRSRNPLQFGYWLQDITDKADTASKHGDHEASARYYTALAKAVPDRAIAFAKLCEEEEALGERDKAVAACGAALLREGAVLKDYTHYVHVVLSKQGPLATTEVAGLDQVIKHLREDPNGKSLADVLQCDIAEKTENVVSLEECANALVARAPEDPQTIMYQWGLAMLHGDYAEADKAIAHLKTTKLRTEQIQDFERATAAAAERHRSKLVWGVLAGFLAVVALGFVLVGLRRRSLASPSDHEPPQAPAPPLEGPGEPATTEAS